VIPIVWWSQIFSSWKEENNIWQRYGHLKLSKILDLMKLKVASLDAVGQKLYGQEKTRNEWDDRLPRYGHLKVLKFSWTRSQRLIDIHYSDVIHFSLLC